MDIYDETRKKIENLDQKKLLIFTIIIASILIIVVLVFIVYVNKMATDNKHIFDPSGKHTNQRKEEELKRQEKILEDPEIKEVYEKLFVDRDFSI